MANLDKKYVGITILLVFSVQLGLSQKKGVLLLPITTESTYKEIEGEEDKALEDNNLIVLRELTQIHIQKAHENGNDIEMARAYYYRVITEEPGLALTYSDSIILVTEKSDHLSYPTLGYFLKAHIYYSMGKFEEALTSYLKAYTFALEKNNTSQQREIALSIAAIRNIQGQHYVAADLYKETLELLAREPNYEEDHYHDHVNLLYNLALTHLRLFQLDSAGDYTRRGHIEALKYSDDLTFMDFSLVDAQINFFRSNYGKSRDTILKYLHNLNGTSKAIKLYYLGKIEQKEENHLLAIKYYEKIDSIVNTTGDPFPEIKDVYQQLVMHSTLENEKRKQVEYIEKLIHYDSLLSSNQGGILNQIMISYDLPYLKRQKKQAEEQLKAKNTAVTAVGFLAGLALTSGGFFYYRSRKMKIRLKLLLDGIENKKVIPRKLGEHPAAVPEEIREFILKQLELFESSDLFLSKGLDMSTLAQELGTNTTYLSLIINHYKKMTFPNYLKDLKISCAIHRLGNDSELLRYNYQGLAEMFGFKTAESFSKAFYNKTGVYPSKFLNELKSRETTRHL